MEISHLSDQMKHSEPMGGSADNISNYGTSPKSSTFTLSNAKETQPVNKFNSFKRYKSRNFHSTGDLNAKVNLALIDSQLTINDSQFFEVMYIGKIKVSHKKVPKTFIDDAIPKFKAHDAMKIKNLLLARTRELERQNLSDVSTIQGDLKGMSKDAEDSSDNQSEVFEVEGKKDQNQESVPQRKISEQQVLPMENIPKRSRSASIGAIPVIEQNRTMVFLLGRSDLRLISPDKKQVLLHKNFKDVVTCCQGIENSEHFGIICTENSKKGDIIGYVFKCQNGVVAKDIVCSLKKSISVLIQSTSASDTSVLEQVPEKQELESEMEPQHCPTSCEHCPVVWYNRLCQTIEGLGDKKAFTTIVRFIETMSDEDQDSIMQKFYGIQNIMDYSTKERNEFLLTFLEAHCQIRQKTHVHDTPENRSEFLNQYLGGSTIFTKAKKTLTNSFDHLLKRRSSKDIVDHMSENNEINRPKMRMRSNSVNTQMAHTQTFKEDPPKVTSPKMDIFMKVGNSGPKDEDLNSSWRQEILKNVVVPTEMEVSDTIKFLPSSISKKSKPKEKLTKEQLRELWKFAFRQVLLLKKMETENARLKRRQNDHEIKKIKLEYDEIMPSDECLIDVWDEYINQASRTTHPNNSIFLQAIKSGVPKTKRGEVWLMLAEQFNKNHPPIETSHYPFFTTPYVDILKNLTEHQHAIFMDIGRTFPNHEFYKAPFGLGQLSLFNLLKAYSILDPEVGYCQGLAFICGVLLLHLTEKDAFYLLKHLMFKRQMRLKYLPDMKEFQLQLYQLSRLIKDHLPELYNHLDKNEISPTLWASGWLLTIFSSCFPLGFVSRVMDLLLFATDEVIFRVILALLDAHYEQLLKLEGFEEITDYLKNTIPQIDQITMTKVFKKVYILNISRQLADYKIEYNVLKEEIKQTNKHLENLKKSQEETKKVEKQLKIAQSNVDRLENIRQNQQQDNQKLQIQIRSLETTIQTLGDYLTNLAINRTDIDVPSDIRRLLQQLESQHNQQRQAMMKRHPNFADRKISKSMSVNSNLGMGLKVLIEQNENEASSQQKSPALPTMTPLESLPAQASKKKFFQNTYEQIKKQNSYKSKAIEEEVLEAADVGDKKRKELEVDDRQKEKPETDKKNEEPETGDKKREEPENVDKKKGAADNVESSVKNLEALVKNNIDPWVKREGSHEKTDEKLESPKPLQKPEPESTKNSEKPTEITSNKEITDEEEFDLPPLISSDIQYSFIRSSCRKK